jgi:hypothetical protein
VSLGDGLVEGLALRSRDAELQLSGLARTVTGGEGSCAPGGSTVDLIEVGKHGCVYCISLLFLLSRLRKYSSLTKGGLVSEWYVDEAVMCEGAHAGNGSALLSTTEGSGADEHAGVFAPERTLCPLLASLIPECLELGWEVSVTGGDTEKNAVEGFEIGGVVEDGHIGLGRGVHLRKDIVGECLGDSVGVVLAPSWGRDQVYVHRVRVERWDGNWYILEH